MAYHLRNLGDGPFDKGEFDFEKIKKHLSMGRDIDLLVLEKLKTPIEKIEDLNEEQLLSCFNDLLRLQSLYSKIDAHSLELKPDIKKLLEKVHHATVYGKAADRNEVEKLNRALLSLIFLKPTAKIRKYERFSAAALYRTEVLLKPLPPLYGDDMRAMLTNLSAGGMALVLRERLKPGSQLILEARFPDKTIMKAKVEIKHARAGKDQHTHGFEFLDLPGFQGKKFEKMAKDYNECEKRIDANEEDVCRLDCSFYNICRKPQKR